MRNHHEKVRDISRSVLPSTSRRSARKTRKLIHRAERHAVAGALRRGCDPVEVRDFRSDLGEMVWERRGADKVAPLIRWALHHVRINPGLQDAALDDQIEYFRQLLPDTTIGRHALSHIAWPLERQHPDRPSERWFRYYPPETPPAPLEPTVRRLYEAGYHAELNKRLKTFQLPTLAGVADIDRFSAAAGHDAHRVIERLSAEVHLRK